MFQAQAREDISNSPAFNGKASARARRETMQPSSAMATSVSTCVLLETYRIGLGKLRETSQEVPAFYGTKHDKTPIVSRFSHHAKDLEVVLD